MDFDADTRADLGKLKSALEKVTGGAEDPLGSRQEHSCPMIRALRKEWRICRCSPKAFQTSLPGRSIGIERPSPAVPNGTATFYQPTIVTAQKAN